MTVIAPIFGYALESPDLAKRPKKSATTGTQQRVQVLRGPGSTVVVIEFGRMSFGSFTATESHGNQSNRIDAYIQGFHYQGPSMQCYLGYTMNANMLCRQDPPTVNVKFTGAPSLTYPLWSLPSDGGTSS